MNIKIFNNNIDNLVILQILDTSANLSIWTDEAQQIHRKNLNINKHKYIVDMLEKISSNLYNKKKHLEQIKMQISELEQAKQNNSFDKKQNMVYDNADSIEHKNLMTYINNLLKLYEDFIKFKYQNEITSKSKKNYNNIDKYITIFYYEMLKLLSKGKINKLELENKIDVNFIKELVLYINSNNNIEFENYKGVLEIVGNFIKISNIQIDNSLLDIINKIITSKSNN